MAVNFHGQRPSSTSACPNAITGHVTVDRDFSNVGLDHVSFISSRPKANEKNNILVNSTTDPFALLPSDVDCVDYFLLLKRSLKKIICVVFDSEVLIAKKKKHFKN